MWTYLPPEILLSVFMCLNTLDLIMVSRTCRSWRSVSKDPTLWGTIDSTEFARLVSGNAERSPVFGRGTSMRIMQHLKSAVNLSSGAASCLAFHWRVAEVGAHQLLYIAMRTPKLRRVVLPVINQSNIDSFVKALKYWRDLESVTIVHNDADDDVFFRALGKNCKRLTHLKIHCPLWIQPAKAIGFYLPGLRVLSLRNTLVFQGALLYVLGALGSLEVLNLSHVFIGDIEWHMDGAVALTACIDLSNEVIAAAARLGSGFLTCRGRLCVRCKGLEECPFEEIDKFITTESCRYAYDEVPEFCM